MLQATDVFAAFLFYLEGNAVASGLTLAFVFAPGIFIFTTECAKGSGVSRVKDNIEPLIQKTP